MVSRRFGFWTEFPSCLWLGRTTTGDQLSCSGCVVLISEGAQDEMWLLLLVGGVNRTLQFVTAQGRTVGHQLSFYKCTYKMETAFTDRNVGKISYLGAAVCPRTILWSLFYFSFVWFAPFSPWATILNFVIYTGCFTTLGHNCRRWFPRSLLSKKFI